MKPAPQRLTFPCPLITRAVFGNQAGWNNYSAFMNTGFVANNLVDDTGLNTGISMRIVKEFTGENNFGVNTGNNSGIFPDRVIRGAYYLDPGADAHVAIRNLSFLKKYNFSFFGSRGDGTNILNRNTDYTINGVTLTLNASSNSNNIVQIKDVVPDADGTITITIRTTTGSLYGYLNGLVIQAVPGGGGGGGVASREAAPLDVAVNEESRDNRLGIEVYPNPFTDRVGMRLGAEMPEGFAVQVINTTGVTVYSGEFTRMPAGQELELLFGQDLPGGVYIMRVITKGGFGTNFRLVKN
jgi:large repetitive protein